jgi:hypothetical protein
MELFEIAGREFYFDLDEISEFIRMSEEDSIDDLLKDMSLAEGDDVNEEIPATTAYDIPQGQMVDITKWEMTKAMIETVLNENGIVDEAMGVTKLGGQLSIPFRLSFNTLMMNKLIKENE